VAEQRQGERAQWALILGASSGFGAATAVELARSGFHIVGVHLDRSTTLPLAEQVKEQVRACGREALFFNVNAADAQRRAEVLDAVASRFREEPGVVSVVLHSLAFGTLLPFIAPDPRQAISQKQLEMTLDVMANSLVYWVQDLVARKLLDRGSKVFAMTSAGGHRVWAGYGAVSAAKAALESHVRQLALELGPMGICVNAIQAGVTDTPAARKIPGFEQLAEFVRTHNPMGRMTTPQDVAQAIAALSTPKTNWITGTIIRVDGGEDIVG